MRQREKKSGTRTKQSQCKKKISKYSWYRIKCSRGFQRRNPLGWENQGGLHRGQESFWKMLAFQRTSFVGSTTFFTSASVCDLHSSGVGWLEHSPGSQVHSHEDSGPSGLCPHVTPMTGELSYLVNMCVGRGPGRRGCWAKSKTDLIKSPSYVVKFRWGELPGPVHFPSILPTPPCYEPPTKATPAHWGY